MRVTALESTGHPVPEPSRRGKFIQLPKSLSARLVAHAKQEGISINALVSTLIAESIGKREAHQGG
ncbi:MAG: toxin-antitoxin system HicB family antitoxin [Pseudomonadota bacterium]